MYLSAVLSAVVVRVGVGGSSVMRSTLDAPTAPGALSGRLAISIAVGGPVGSGPASVVVAMPWGVCCVSVAASALSASVLIVSGADLTHGEHWITGNSAGHMLHFLSGLAIACKVLTSAGERCDKVCKDVSLLTFDLGKAPVADTLNIELKPKVCKVTAHSLFVVSLDCLLVSLATESSVG